MNVGLKGIFLGGPRAIGARYRKAATASIADTTFVTVTLDTMDFDTDKFFNPVVPTRLTMPIPGIYFVFASVSYGAFSGGSRFVGIKKNGSLYVASQTGPSFALDTMYDSVNSVVRFNAGDYIELIAWQGSGGGRNLNGGDEHSPVIGCAYLGAS